jgi:hypothetical protein
MVNEKETPSPHMPFLASKNRYADRLRRERLGRHKNLNRLAFLRSQPRTGQGRARRAKKIAGGL